MTEQVYIRDLSSHRIHIGVKTAQGRLLTSEACNLDDSGAKERLDTLPLDAHESDYCRRCFPEPPPDLEVA